MHGLKRRVWVQNTYVVEIAVAIERRGGCVGLAQFSRQGEKQIPGAL